MMLERHQSYEFELDDNVSESEGEEDRAVICSSC